MYLKIKSTIRNTLQEFNLSKKKIHEYYQNKLISVNDKNVGLDDKLDGEKMKIDFTKVIKTFKPYNKTLEVLYEDEYFLIVNKPKNCLVHPDGNDEKTLANMVSNYYEKKHELSSVYYPHRIDKDTTGCVLFAKNAIIESYMDKLFTNHSVQRTYLALVSGKVEKEGIINKPIGRDRHENKMRISNTGLQAITHYQVEKTLSDRTLLKVTLETGRTHQIRVHLSSINHPLIGDTLYGGMRGERPLLHSYSIEFIHPITNKKISTVAPLPSDFN